MVLTRTGLRFLGRHYPCTIGRGGVRRAKREGDGATPAGVHRLVGLLYRPDRIGRPADWAVPIRPRDGWSDDPADPDYNLMVRTPHPYGHEALRRPDPVYDIVLVTDWNWPRAVRGAGSAIFIHAWRGPGKSTAGCVALPPATLRAIVPRITHATRLVVPVSLAA